MAPLGSPLGWPPNVSPRVPWSTCTAKNAGHAWPRQNYRKEPHVGFDFAKYDTGGAYINAAEKKAIAEAGIPVTINSVREGDYKGEPRYVLSVTVPNPETGDDEERLLAFPIGSGVESRDSMLKALAEYLDGADAEPVKAKIELKGKSYLLREA